jgi:hypothetical protein
MASFEEFTCTNFCDGRMRQRQEAETQSSTTIRSRRPPILPYEDRIILLKFDLSILERVIALLT